VKRQAVEVAAVVEIIMTVACEADKAPCDELVRTFGRMTPGVSR
jgi:hypothetical protein